MLSRCSSLGWRGRRRSQVHTCPSYAFHTCPLSVGGGGTATGLLRKVSLACTNVFLALVQKGEVKLASEAYELSDPQFRHHNHRSL